MSDLYTIAALIIFAYMAENSTKALNRIADAMEKAHKPETIGTEIKGGSK